jgi:hypothetical protein
VTAGEASVVVLVAAVVVAVAVALAMGAMLATEHEQVAPLSAGSPPYCSQSHLSSTLAAVSGETAVASDSGASIP